MESMFINVGTTVEEESVVVGVTPVEVGVAVAGPLVVVGAVVGEVAGPLAVGDLLNGNNEM